MNASAELLKELRIDRKAPPPPPRKGLWIGLGVAALLVLLLALGGWWLFGRPDPVQVRTQTVVAMGSGTTAAASVLDATGYVVARRNTQVARDQQAIAENGLDNTVVRAPFAGVVIAKAAQPGEIVSPLSAGGGFTRTGIGTVVDMDSLEVEVDVGEAFIGRVKPGMPVEATLNAYPDWKIPAEVIAIIPTADRGKATVKVRIALKQKDPRIVPDMGVNVSFLERAAPAATQAPPRGVRVPAAAIVEREGEDVAFAMDGEDRVELREVEVGRALGDDRQVVSGLSAGDRVVLAPAAGLEDGSRVQLAQDTVSND